MIRLPLLTAVVALTFATVACGGDDGGAADVPADDVTDIELEPIDQGAGGDDATAEDSATPGAEKPEVVIPDSLPTELVITDLIDGSGRAAETGDTVVVDYVGVRSADGNEFDNSFDRGVPFSVPLGQGRVIAGWDEGLIGVQVGTRRQIDIPADLAYGDNPPGGSSIQPGDALTFVVDVRAVVPSVTEDDAPLDLEIETSTGWTELGIDDVVVGDGPELLEGQTAIVHLLLRRGDDLEVVDNTWSRADPAQIPLAPGNVIEGLYEGLQGMRVGGLRVLSIPSELAFGAEGVPSAGLPGDLDVIIVAELVGSY